MLYVLRRIIGLAAGLALIVGAVASTSGAEDAGSRVMLRPGLNAVGWVSEKTTVAELFTQVLEIETIWAWDGWAQEWTGAARGAPDELQGLKEVLPGMAALLAVGGDEAVEMERSSDVATGTVSLSPGWNFASWLGRDEVALEHALRGIGKTMQSVLIWDAGQQDWTEPEEGATVDRGDALMVEADWGVEWLQPTYVMPVIKTIGLSDVERERTQRYVREVLELYDEQWGIQADPFQFSIYVPASFDALVQQYIEDGVVRQSSLTAAREGWLADEKRSFQQNLLGYVPGDRDVGRYIVIDADSFSTHAHEYFHILQLKLSSRQSSYERGSLRVSDLRIWRQTTLGPESSDFILDIPDWITEGSATFAEETIMKRYISSDSPYEQYRSFAIEQLRESSLSLDNTQADNGSAYPFGFLAFDLLVAASNPDTIIDLYRDIHIYSPARGPDNRWIGSPSLASSFARAFEIGLQNFLTEFGEWQCQQIAKLQIITPTRCDATTASHSELAGVVTREDGQPLRSVRLIACNADAYVSTRCLPNDTAGEAITASDGNFSMQLPAGRYWLDIELGLDCPTNYRIGSTPAEGGWPGMLYEIGLDERENVRILVPDSACGPRVTGGDG